MSSITYISTFAKDIDNYIQFKCSMGYSKSTYDNALVNVKSPAFH